nr:hypothetical protein [Lachnospiraceae bacterium]
MKNRCKKLMAWILVFTICLQMESVFTLGAPNYITTDYTLESDSYTDGYVVTSGGVLRLAPGLTVNNEVTLQSGVDQGTGRLIIPSGATMNAKVNIGSGYYNNRIENAGTITVNPDLVSGTIINEGRIQSLNVADEVILYSNDGASYGVLNVSTAGSGAFVTEGTMEADTFVFNGYAFSGIDSSATTVRINDLFSYTGSTEFPDKISIVLNSKTATKITTEGQDGLSVYFDGIKYPLPAITMSSKALSDIYSVSPDKSSVSFSNLAVGYQTVKTDTVNVKNNGMTDCMIKLVPSGAWSDMFAVKSGGSTVAYNVAFELGTGSSCPLGMELKKGLKPGVNEGVLTMQYCTPEGTVYDSVKISGKVTVEKIPSIDAPSDFYTLSGTKGDNGFYRSDVEVVPKSGYQIAKSLSDDFADTVTYTKTTKKPDVYLVKTSTGQITEKMTVETIKIDKDKPDINRKDDKTYYADSLSVKVEDDYLHSVTVNGAEQTIENSASAFKVAAGDDETKYTIKAKDKAGNVAKISFYLYPKWREDGAVPKGKSVKLYKGKAYSFGEGTWTVNGDSTSYAGGNSFYVKSDGQYTMSATN